MHDVGIPGTVMAFLNKSSVSSNEILFSFKYKYSFNFIRNSSLIYYIIVIRIASLDIPTCMMGLWAFSNAFPHDSLTYAFFIDKQSLRVLGMELTFIVSRKKWNETVQSKMKKTQWRYLAIMATVDPIGIIFLQTELILHAITARSDKPWPRSR